MGLSTNPLLDWFHFYREVCDEIMMKRCEKIGGTGKRVQIDEKTQVPSWASRRKSMGSWRLVEQLFNIKLTLRSKFLNRRFL